MKSIRLALLSLATLIVVATGASAATYHVATSGSDTNPGSSSQPWRTLQHAVDSIAAGDTIIVEAGSYAGCRIGRSGTANTVCTLTAASPGSVVINAVGSANRHSSLIEVENFSATVRYWVIDGFEAASSPRYGIDLRDTDFVTVQNCVVHNSAVTGIFLAFCYHPLIQNNESYSNGEHGIYQSNSGDFPTIRGNDLHHNANAGIHMNGDRNFTPGDGIISFAVVEKNVVWENGRSGGSGINCDGVSDSIIRNNLLYNNHASGVSLYAIDAAEGSSRNRVYNNTIVMAADGRWCVNIPASSEGQPNPVGNDVKNNILYTPHSFRGSVSTYGGAVAGFSSDYNVVVNHFSTDSGGSNITLAQWQALGYDQHSIVATPAQLFNNPAGDDYSPRPGSPAIDAGVSLSSDVRDDLVGTTRPQGRGYDIGCYEVVGGASGPLADFSASPLSGVAPLAVQFADLSTGGPTGWAWDFGDGSTSTLRSPSHAYQNAGSFTVKLTASNSGGQSTKTRASYVVVSAGGSPPLAEFRAAPLSGSAPLAVQFTDQSTGAEAWLWDFGDGAGSSERSPSHTYQSGGVFNVALTVTNQAGQNTRTRAGYITVTAPPSAPVADFTASPLSGTAPLTVQFTDLSSGAPTSWAWDFGDSSTSNERNPSHTYQAAGTFTVSLTVSSAAGQSGRTRTAYIIVNSPAARDYFCASISIEAGKRKSGNHESVHSSDDSYLYLKTVRMDGDKFGDVVTYVFETGLASLSSLSVTSESRSSKAPERQQISLFNIASGGWELVDERSIAITDETTVMVSVPNPSRYVSPSGQVKLRIRTGDTRDAKWKHYIDLVKIAAAP